jgi:3,4-dihydroxy 2-butanone 4-phosphate synthase/GTP cyclohydrolase II
MVESNNAAYETPFTVSVDLIGHGCTTGISAQDRAKTIKALINPLTRPEELGKPGHIFPLKAKKKIRGFKKSWTYRGCYRFFKACWF